MNEIIELFFFQTTVWIWFDYLRCTGEKGTHITDRSPVCGVHKIRKWSPWILTNKTSNPVPLWSTEGIWIIWISPAPDEHLKTSESQPLITLLWIAHSCALQSPSPLITVQCLQYHFSNLICFASHCVHHIQTQMLRIWCFVMFIRRHKIKHIHKNAWSWSYKCL